MNAPYYSYAVQTLTLSSGQEIAYTDTGSGPTILMVHGLGSYLPVYQKLIDELSSQYRCIAIDLPGFGRSGWPVVDTITIPWFASQVQGFIEDMELEAVTLMGHSMGAQVSLRLAIEHPEALERLVLLAPAGSETFTPEEGAQLKQLITPASIFALEQAQIQQNFSVNFSTNQLPEDAQFMYEVRLSLKADSASYQRFSTTFAQCVYAMLDGPVFSELGQIELPALVLYGENDWLIPNRYLHPEMTTAAVGDTALKYLPHSEVSMLPLCGHFIPWEQPQMVQEALLSFLNEAATP